MVVATRVIRGWNQTGQKFAGDHDLVKIFLYPYPICLWILVSAAYLWIHRELVRGFDGLPTSLDITGSTGIVLAGYTFKLAFTNEDAPELVISFARHLVELTAGASLVMRAQAVFVGLAVAAACVMVFIATKTRVSSKASGKQSSSTWQSPH